MWLNRASVFSNRPMCYKYSGMQYLKVFRWMRATTVEGAIVGLAQPYIEHRIGKSYTSKFFWGDWLEGF